MKNDTVKQYVALHAALKREKAELEQRLAEINKALSGQAPPASSAVRRPKARRGPRKRNAMSLREAVVQATSKKALTKDAILEAVQRAGYKFTTNKPMSSINVVLYGRKPKFKNDKGKFSPVK